MKKINSFAEICCQTISEGVVLLENDGSLPLLKGENVALYGRGQFEYVKSGTGSGGRVNCDYVTNIKDYLEKEISLNEKVSEFYRQFIKDNPYDIDDGWKGKPIQKQPMLTDDFVKGNKRENEKAVYIISRMFGEAKDIEEEKGNWYLSDEEENCLSLLTKYYNNVIVLINSGNIIDMNFVKKFNIGTVMYIWQGGQEGGKGTVRALMGTNPPSGHLTDTIANSIKNYPAYGNWGMDENIHKEDIYVGYRYFETFAKDKVLYPFGYGLTYTTFEQELKSTLLNDKTISFKVNVKNTGNYVGKQVVQIYYSYPESELGAPAKQLVAFKKSKLLVPSESELMDFKIKLEDMACYDDSGISGYPYCYVFEKGEYKFFIGDNIRDSKKVYILKLEKTKVVKKCQQALAPENTFTRLTKNGYEQAPIKQYRIEDRINENLPKEIEIKGDLNITLQDVKENKNSLDEFVSQFNEKQLMQLVRGEGMSSDKAPLPGTASCFGGVVSDFYKKGVPVVTTCDGPSGVRLESGVRATCIPSGVLIASTWNPEGVNKVFDYFASEALSYNIDMILAPGMNIHRHPLCGRNFEYFSEDPYLTGVFAKKIAERFYKKGVYCTIKHFAVNSQEKNRTNENEIVSERALREIYLKPFEIAVKSGYVKAIMTSYNRINGVSSAGNYDLTTTILREDWGYKGMVMTDWWTMIDSQDKTSFNGKNLAEMVKAQNDVYMVVDDAVTYEDNMMKSFESGYLKLGELQRSAKNILNFILTSKLISRGEKIKNLQLLGNFKKIKEFNLENLPLIDCSAEDSWVFKVLNKKVKKISVELPKENMYIGEIEYCSNDGISVQKKFSLCVDGHEPTIAICNGTNGKIGKKTIKIYLKENSKIVFDSDEITKFFIYELN